MWKTVYKNAAFVCIKQMARTKQTARKTTTGMQPALIEPRRSPRLAGGTAPMAPPPQPPPPPNFGDDNPPIPTPPVPQGQPEPEPVNPVPPVPLAPEPEPPGPQPKPSTSGDPPKSPRKRTNAQTGFTSDEDEATPEKKTKDGEEDTNDDENENENGPGIGRKDLAKIKPKKPKKSMKLLAREWNKSARIGYTSETAQGWLKKAKDLRQGQKKNLKRAKPGLRALREIRHYQRCQSFLIQVKPFVRVVREACEDVKPGGLRWQSNALFILQTATEAYMAGFFNDVNLCALHRKVITINRKDIWLAVQVRGREHVGGKPEVSDVGAFNDDTKRLCYDKSETKRIAASSINPYACLTDWPAKLRKLVAPDGGNPPRGGGRGRGKPGTKRMRRVLADSIHAIPRTAICRMARRGGVERISGMIYEECRGVLKSFVQIVVKDIIIFTEHCRRKTVTPMDVIFALKNQGRNVYGFTRPYSYSVRKEKKKARTGDDE